MMEHDVSDVIKKCRQETIAARLLLIIQNKLCLKNFLQIPRESLKAKFLHETQGLTITYAWIGLLVMFLKLEFFNIFGVVLCKFE